MKTFVTRPLLWLFTRIFYQVKVLSVDNLPATGGALLVSNHLSFVDLVLILASTRRSIRFLLPESICELWLLKPFLRRLRVIPVPAFQQTRGLSPALQLARDAIEQGEIVGIFAENSISRIG